MVVVKYAINARETRYVKSVIILENVIFVKELENYVIPVMQLANV